MAKSSKTFIGERFFLPKKKLNSKNKLNLQMKIPILTPEKRSKQHERSFSLIVLIQLFSFCIALVVCIDGKKLKQGWMQANFEVSTLVWGVLILCLLGLCSGLWVGLGQIRYFRSVLICSITGTLLWMFVLAIYIAPANPMAACAAIALPLLTTLAIRARTA